MTITTYDHIKAYPGELPTPSKREQNSLLLRLVQFGFSTLGHLFPKSASKIAYKLFTTPRSKAFHKSSDPILESAKLFEVLYGKRILKAYEWGTGLKTVLLVHGWESRGTALRSFVPSLVNSGYRVIAFDGPAHGDSAGTRTNLAHFSGAITAMIRQIGSVNGIIAHSFGGAASMFALSRTNLPTSIEKIVLIGTPAKVSYVVKQASEILKLPRKVSKNFITHLESIIEMPLEKANIEELLVSTGIKRALILHDIDDKAVPFQPMSELAAKWPAAELISTEGMGHHLIMKHPKIIEKVTTFISKS